MHMRCETVKVESDSKNGFAVINESDFDEKAHKLYKPKPSKDDKKDDKKGEKK